MAAMTRSLKESREARIQAAMLKGACADARGRREEAVGHYRAAAALMGRT
jgi:Flp pilus assembly protein TadD